MCQKDYQQTKMRLIFHSELIASQDAIPICERFVGFQRRKNLDHMLVLNQKHLNIITRDYVKYYNESRLHQGLAQ